MLIAVAREGTKVRIPEVLAWPMSGTREVLEVPDDREQWNERLRGAFKRGAVVEVPAVIPEIAVAALDAMHAADAAAIRNQPRPVRPRRSK